MDHDLSVGSEGPGYAQAALASADEVCCCVMGRQGEMFICLFPATLSTVKTPHQARHRALSLPLSAQLERVAGVEICCVGTQMRRHQTLCPSVSQRRHHLECIQCRYVCVQHVHGAPEEHDEVTEMLSSAGDEDDQCFDFLRVLEQVPWEVDPVQYFVAGCGPGEVGEWVEVRSGLGVDLAAGLYQVGAVAVEGVFAGFGVAHGEGVDHVAQLDG